VRDKEDCAAEGEAWQRLARVEVVSSGRWSGRSVNESKQQEKENTAELMNVTGRESRYGVNVSVV
jgi:hypothetical protein